MIGQLFNIMKIYIMGSTGSGKTTLSRRLSKKYNIDTYELDKIVYDDECNHVKRTDKEIDKLFQKMIGLQKMQEEINLQKAEKKQIKYII